MDYLWVHSVHVPVQGQFSSDGLYRWYHLLSKKQPTQKENVKQILELKILAHILCYKTPLFVFGLIVSQFFP